MGQHGFARLVDVCQARTTNGLPRDATDRENESQRRLREAVPSRHLPAADKLHRKRCICIGTECFIAMALSQGLLVWVLLCCPLFFDVAFAVRPTSPR
jgi:hypothetical protein